MIYQKLVAEFPLDPTYRNELGWAFYREGGVAMLESRLADAEYAYRQAVAIEAKLAAESPNVPDYKYVVGLCQISLGSMWASMGRGDESEEALTDGIVLLEELNVEVANPRPAYAQNLLHPYRVLVPLMKGRDRRDVAESLLGTSAQRFSKLTKDYPDVAVYREVLAEIGRLLGELRQQNGK